ncbi:MAG: HAMP domain-containing histidine kinase, partial [Nitrospira sp.]|nr:HAMP domain-containing histidine kinase [Nitrospira sp.]
DQVCVRVTDNGPGMSAEILKKVGTPFFTTRSEGTGLGLNQCHRLVEGIGGSFAIESTVGEGTTVILKLPLVVKSS